MCTYLDQVAATYYFRRVVPVELRPFIRTNTGAPRAEWKISLRTKDRETAKRLLPHHVMATDKEIDAARKQLAPTRPPAPQDALAEAAQASSERAALIEQALFERGQEAAEFAYRDEAAREARYDDREPLRQRLERTFRKSTAEITPEEAAWRDLLRDAREGLSQAQLSEATKAVEKAETRRGHTVSRVTARAVTAPADAKRGAIMLGTVVDRWAAERSPAQKTKDMYGSIAREFDERVGSISEWTETPQRGSAPPLAA